MNLNPFADKLLGAITALDIRETQTGQRLPFFREGLAAALRLEIAPDARRATQREIDEQAERFTEAQRGKPQRINPHE